jgi:hypothetical protein
VRDIDHIQVDSLQDAYLGAEFTDTPISIIRGTQHPDFTTAKHILTDRFELSFPDLYDAWGQLQTE